MESERESQSGICCECSVKDGDSSQKQVYHCELCDKWFCEKHLNPKFPYFVDWETVFDVQGNPQVKSLFYSEYRRVDGHPDFIFLRKTIEALELEEKTRNELIKKAIDRMVQIPLPRKPITTVMDTATYDMPTRTYGKTTRTYGNIHHYSFEVFTEVYSNKEYRKRLDNAKTMDEVENIEKEYFSHHPNPKEQPSKKEHWWQK